jgi:hypothetical protein
LSSDHRPVHFLALLLAWRDLNASPFDDKAERR